MYRGRFVHGAEQDSTRPNHIGSNGCTLERGADGRHFGSRSTSVEGMARSGVAPSRRTGTDAIGAARAPKRDEGSRRRVARRAAEAGVQEQSRERPSKFLQASRAATV